MNERQLQIVAEGKATVTEIFKNKVTPLFAFHNLDHTLQVVNAAEEIAGHYHLNDNGFHHVSRQRIYHKSRRTWQNKFYAIQIFITWAQICLTSGMIY